MDVSNVFDGPETGLRTMPEQGRSDEVDSIRAEMGARVLRAVDTGGQHRVRGPNGADYENFQHTAEPVGSHLRSLSGARRCLYPVFGEDLQDGVPRNVRFPTRPGDACDHRGRKC